ncbi:hypothetical protein MKW94_012399 [Papaver nudicaule]|uniref:Uncharacterized protein n=1 Tax=Papaver nudicaule TaxID=74823 RepID=A0AA41VUH6_PAPNU|nr:hypothetical protein [Papaver nudicaule]
MYATRPLSLYLEDPNELSWLAPGEAHGSSGCLFITDNKEESVVLKDGRGFLFPHNYRKGVGYYRGIEWEKVWFIPVPDQPMSPNIYHVIRANDRHKGQAITCSREEDMSTCFCYKYIKDIKPKTGWNLYKSDSKLCQLTKVSGLKFSIRNLIPDLNFLKHWQNSSPHQMENSLFFERTLEQFWEAIYKCENNDYAPRNVLVVSLFGMEATMDKTNDGTDGIQWVWNKIKQHSRLNITIVEKIRCERFGCKRELETDHVMCTILYSSCTK